MKCLPVTVSAAEDADGEETQGGGPGSPPTIVGGLWAGTRSAPRWQWWYRTHPPRQETLETWVPSLGWEDPLEEGHGYPLQYFYRENLVDRGAWWATVHGVPKSRTRLKRLGTAQR